MANREYSAGEHSVKFDAGDLSSCVYLYRMQAGDFHEIKKMIVLVRQFLRTSTFSIYKPNI
ncbi:MAG: hypothetical protein P8Z35_14820 [Ignavibacteriaceae bacterium]